MEKRALDGVVELRGDGDSQKIHGMAAVFYRSDDAGTEYKLWDDMVERLMPTAFDRALEERDDVRALFNHDANIILGRTTNNTLQLAKTKRGLSYEVKPPDTQQARDVLELLRRGDVSGSSFGFVAQDVSWREVDKVLIREIRGVELLDVSPVVYPAYTSTTSGVRSRDSLLNEADKFLERQKPKRHYALRLAAAKAKSNII